jgi:hypothetical protein
MRCPNNDLQLPYQSEGVQHDQRLGRVTSRSSTSRPSTANDQPAGDEKADPHDSRSAVATARRVVPPASVLSATSGMIDCIAGADAA